MVRPHLNRAEREELAIRVFQKYLYKKEFKKRQKQDVAVHQGGGLQMGHNSRLDKKGRGIRQKNISVQFDHVAKIMTKKLQTVKRLFERHPTTTNSQASKKN